MVPAELNSKLRPILCTIQRRIYYIYILHLSMRIFRCGHPLYKIMYHRFVLFCRKGTILVCFVATQRRVCCSNFYKMLTFERDGDRKLIFAKCELNLNVFTSCTNIVSHSLFIICTIHAQIKSPKFRKLTSILLLYDQSSNVTSHVNSERWAIYDF